MKGALKLSTTISLSSCDIDDATTLRRDAPAEEACGRTHASCVNAGAVDASDDSRARQQDVEEPRKFQPTCTVRVLI